MMKNLFLILFLTAINVQSQSTNQLTAAQFNNIKINGVFKTSIENTDGDIQQMVTLLGLPASIEEGGENIGEKWRKFTYMGGLCILFEGLSANQSPEVVKIEANSITINGLTANVGDNISSLGTDLVINQNSDGPQSIIFTRLDADCCPIIIHFHSVSNTITKIEYLVFT